MHGSDLRGSICIRSLQRIPEIIIIRATERLEDKPVLGDIHRAVYRRREPAPLFLPLAQYLSLRIPLA